MQALSVNKVKELSDFVAIISELNGSRERGALYRGQSDVQYEITSTLHRALNRSNPTTLLRAANGFRVFQKERHLYHDINAVSQWDELCLAQHYGLPTRLLDWSLDPLVALYFALENIDKHEAIRDACVYMISGEADLTWATSDELEGDPFGIVNAGYGSTENIVLVPDYLNLRVRNQSGVFTLSKNVTSTFPKSELHHIVIPRESARRIHFQLLQLGVSRKKIYMDVESLCADIKRYHY